jgi:predicted amidophosphoribosyltransferase
MPTKRYDRLPKFEVPREMTICDYCGRWTPQDGQCGHCGDTAELNAKYDRWSKVPYNPAPSRRVTR